VEDVIMRSFKAIGLVVGLFVASAQVVGAQDKDSAEAACSQNSQTAGSYEQCSLWLERGQLKRGMPGDVVTQVRLLSPMSLSQFVAGDSARRYAFDYERYARRGSRMSFVGSALLLVGFATSHTQPFRSPLDTRANFRTASTAMIVGGVAMQAVGVSFTLRSARASARAVWWHNAVLSR
jgi:hypothetical protein